MRKNRVGSAAILALALYGIFGGCQKSPIHIPGNPGKTTPPGNPPANCRIVTMDGRPLSALIHNFYDPSGRIIKSAVQGGFTTFFNYSGDTTAVNVLDGNQFHQRLIITRNAAGLTTNVRTYFDEAGVYWYNNAFEYNGSELSKDSKTASPLIWDHDSTAVRTFTWSDGNMVKMTINGRTSFQFDYYLDKPRQAGDHFALDSLLNGYEIYHTRNLVKQANGVGYAYTFDSEGKINSYEATLLIDNTFNSVKLLYQCD